jgi:hypothetical protein
MFGPAILCGQMPRTKLVTVFKFQVRILSPFRRAMVINRARTLQTTTTLQISCSFGLCGCTSSLLSQVVADSELSAISAAHLALAQSEPHSG